MNQIGLKLADGSFYPVLEEGSAGRKRLILTTVRDNQDTVQIDLYRGEGAGVDTADYLGTLSVEEIEAAPKSDPEIELVLGLDEEGTLSVSAGTLPAGERKTLSLQLGAVSAGAQEFELEREGTAARVKRGTAELDEGLLTGETYPIGPGDRRKEHLHRRKRRPLLLVAFVLLALILIAAIAFVVFRSVDGGRIPPLFGGRQGAQAAEVAAGAEERPATAEEPAAEAPTGEEPAAAESQPTAEAAAGESSGTGAAGQDVAAAAEKKTPAPSAGGAWYSIKRGDTLWDIAATYYRNPWLYPKIARANQIVNPDLIFAGSKLFIPEP